jgi:endonuclease/exonuclease/phosphatase family metal-dependent hydrolase
VAVSDGRHAAAAAPSRAAAAGGPVELSVLSYNIGGHTALVRRRHVEEIARLIAELRPDIVGLQEVHRTTWQARFRDQAAEIARRTGMAVHFGPSFHALGGAFGNAVLVRGRVLSGEVLALPSFGEPRSLLRARIDVDGQELVLMVTHLAAWGSLNRATRVRQAQCLAERARGDGIPLVLSGDLNAPPESDEIEALLERSPLRMSGRPDEPTYPLLGQRIDYIFFGPEWRVGRANVLHVGPSDHWPITAELTGLGS